MNRTGLPLEGLTVADFSQGVAGPLAAMQLGDLGARVVKVEPLRGDWIRNVGRKVEHGMSPTYISMNRNKVGVSIDMKDPRGMEAVNRLVAESEVLVESFRPGVMERFGLAYETLRTAQPGLVYASVTGYGQSGPYVELPGADSIIQAMGGIMSINGEEGGGPLRFGMFMVDMITGMTANQGILAALLGKGRHGHEGQGQHVQVSLLDAILAFQAPPITEYLMYGQMPERNGNVNSYVAPSGVFRTQDSFLMFTVLDHQWEKGTRALELEHIRDDPRFVTNEVRLTHRDALLVIVREKLAARTTADWLTVLRQHDILCAPIQDYEALVRDPQVLHNAILMSFPQHLFGELPMVGSPVRFGAHDLEYTPPPSVGEHTREVFEGDLGYAPAEVDALLAAGVISAAGEAPSGGAVSGTVAGEDSGAA